MGWVGGLKNDALNDAAEYIEPHQLPDDETPDAMMIDGRPAVWVWDKARAFEASPRTTYAKSPNAR